MKTMTKIIALAMAVLMIVALAACGENGGSAAAPSIIGKWGYNVNLKNVLGASLNSAATDSMTDTQKEAYEKYVNAFDGCEILMYMEFTEDGKATMSVDKDSATAAVDKLKQTLAQILPDFMAAMSGMTQEEYEAQLEAAGMTMDQMVEQSLSSFSADNMVTSSAGTYRLEGDKLYMKPDDSDTETCLTVALSASELKITDVEGEESDSMAMFKSEFLPMVFNKVA